MLYVLRAKRYTVETLIFYLFGSLLMLYFKAFGRIDRMSSWLFSLCILGVYTVGVFHKKSVDDGPGWAGLNKRENGRSMGIHEEHLPAINSD